MTAGTVSRAWSWRHAVTRSGLPPTTRHVLLTLSIWMDEAGGSCYPSIEDLTGATGLSRRAVITHLSGACDAGWLRRQPHGFRGQKWRRLEYEPGWPERDVDLPAEGGGEAVNAAQGGEPAAPPSGEKAVNVVHQGGEPGAPKVVNDVHQDREQSIHHSSTSPEEREGARAEDSPASRSGVPPSAPLADPEAKPTPDELLAALKRDHPNTAADRPSAIDAAWSALKAGEQRAAHDRHGEWLAACKAAGRSKVIALSTYLREKPWTLLSAATKASGDELWRSSGMVPAWSRLWWYLLCRLLEANRATIGDQRSAAAGQLRRQVSLAEARIGWKVDPGQIAGFEAEAAGFVGVPRDGPEAAAWSAWWRERAGVSLPMPDAAAWIFVPAKLPGEEAWRAGGRTGTQETTGITNLSPDDLEGLG